VSNDTPRSDVAGFLALLAQADYPPIETSDPESARASQIASLGLVDLPMGELATVKDLSIPGPGGRIPARLLDARVSRPAGPVVLWFHGGGFVTGGIETHQSLGAQVARELDLPVVLIDYRLAPEAPFPAAPQDAEAAARWLAASPSELGRGVDGLVLAGDSAGGTLSIVTSLALRNASAEAPVLAHLVIYASTDETKTYPSETTFADGYLLTAAGKAWYRSHYRPAATDVRSSPLLASLHGMPPAVVVTAGLDPNRDEGRAYASALIAAGVPTVFREAAGNIHAFLLLRQVIPSSQSDLAGAMAALGQLIAENAAHQPVPH
jgi:acetyl esterase